MNLKSLTEVMGSKKWYVEWTIKDPQDKGDNMCKDCGCGTTDSLLNLLISKRLYDMIKDQEIFSAWDITQNLRKEVGSGYNISHATVRELVAKWYAVQTDGYKKEIVKLKNGKVTNLYSPEECVVSDKFYPDFASWIVEGGDDKQEIDYYVAAPKKDIPLEDVQALDSYCEDLESELEILTDMVKAFLNGELTLNELQDSLDDAKEFLSHGLN